ncbi:GNAT family N-acetyltransferase [Nocardioides sp. Root151]|uniref:GNAT family N-acetyltransferase n=1 Tax=Nocardioides sp. Root151 TaxID=1736475 RepID=UPI0007029921|nr:GNAT family N-acetyltransferase [Nocardioides sp. Root151]KQZ67397.1 hypothetical protein ASD66_20855 [Nocardioides sp. Root151]
MTTANQAPILSGNGVVLRPLAEDDIPRIVEACRDPRTQKWLGSMPSPYDEDDAREWIEASRLAAAEGSKITWAVADPTTHELVGAINLFDIEPGTRAKVGYWSHPSARGTGTMTEACRIALEHAFDDLDLPTVVAHAAVENTASQHVLTANGMRRVALEPGGTTIRTGKVDAYRYERHASEATRPSTLYADDVEAHQGSKPLLPRTTLALDEGEVAVVLGRPGSGHTALALALAGRLPLSAGQVTLDGSQDPTKLQKAVALVDVPGVSEPDGSVPLRTIVGEELAMAKRKASKAAVLSWLAEEGIDAYADSTIDDVPPEARVGALARLASLRPGTRFVVVTYPERHGLHPGSWLELARSLADGGFGVLVTASAAVDLPADVHRFTIGPEEGA